MNDRFKFRAWNKLSNEMKDVISLNINYEFPDCSNVILETNTFDNIKTHNNPITCANGLNNVVLMQCTGLRDKYGKLIYEGDIIKIPDDYATYGHFACEKREVYWNEGFRLKPKWGARARGNWLEDTKDFEVIGNIYENKSLLESEV